MASSQLFRFKSITGKNGVLNAIQHNKRTLPYEKEHIDATRRLLNYSINSDDTPEVIALHAKVQMLKAGIENTRKNGVMAVEYIFSLPVNRHNQDTKPFFYDCYMWVKATFNAELLSFDIHLDEAAPHAHAIILPLIDGKMQGDKLKGDRSNVKRLQNDFHLKVASHYGLSLSLTKKLSVSDKQSIEKQVLIKLENDPVLRSSIFSYVRDSIHRDPIPYAQILGVEILPASKGNIKSFVDHKRCKGKGTFVR